MSDVDRYRQHLIKLARRFGLAITEVPQHALHYAFAVPKDRLVQMPPVLDDTGYAICLHEMGHLMAKDGHHGTRDYTEEELAANTMMIVFERIQEEHAAWRWAEKMAIEWTAGMTQVRDFALANYARKLHETQAQLGRGHYTLLD